VVLAVLEHPGGEEAAADAIAPGAAERAWLRCGLDSLSRRPIEAGGTLENAQVMAAHESPRTTKLYDRTGDEITLDEVERIRI